MLETSPQVKHRALGRRDHKANGNTEEKEGTRIRKDNFTVPALTSSAGFVSQKHSTTLKWYFRFL